MKKRIAIGTVLVAGWFLVFLFLPAWQEELPALRDHVKEMKGEYPALDKVHYQYARDSFYVDLHVSDMEAAEEIRQGLQAFLSSDAFLTEFLSSAESRNTESGSSGQMPSYPDLWISCYPTGEKERQWASYAMYYTEPYRSDRTLVVDGYQTWYDS